jgi:lipoprotein-releasing system ATP-binding protein
MSQFSAPLHPMEETEILRVEGLRKVYRSGAAELVVFDNLSFRVAPGELVAIVGQSGSGKSTLLHILGVLDAPSDGELYFGQVRLRALKEEAAANFRNRQVGYVWQFHYLLPEFTAEENVAMPLLIRGEDPNRSLKKARQWLHDVGLAPRASHRSGELSGGEQQRVALARALVSEPKLLLADEPTGDLDSQTAEVVFELIRNLHRVHGLTSLIATHNLAFARRCDRVLRLQQGKMQEVSPESLPLQ